MSEADHPEVPIGVYCYTIVSQEGTKLKTVVCPHWSRDNSKPYQQSGYCALLKEAIGKFEWGYCGINVKSAGIIWI